MNDKKVVGTVKVKSNGEIVSLDVYEDGSVVFPDGSVRYLKPEFVEEAKQRAEAERIEREKLELEKAEAERLIREQQEIARIAAQKEEEERKERERIAAEKAERERIEAERREQERVAAEQERIRREEELARQKAELERQAALEAERKRLAQEEEERQIAIRRAEALREEQERIEKAMIEEERKREEARLAAEAAAAKELARVRAEEKAAKMAEEARLAKAKAEEEERARTAEELSEILARNAHKSDAANNTVTFETMTGLFVNDVKEAQRKQEEEAAAAAQAKAKEEEIRRQAEMEKAKAEAEAKHKLDLFKDVVPNPDDENLTVPEEPEETASPRRKERSGGFARAALIALALANLAVGILNVFSILYPLQAQLAVKNMLGVTLEETPENMDNCTVEYYIMVTDENGAQYRVPISNLVLEEGTVKGVYDSNGYNLLS